jgi:hypothetical protein
MRTWIALSTALLAVASLTGCAAEDNTADEDAAAASSDGKTDGSTFALGPYINWSYDEGAPLLAFFHAPDVGEVPDGETGLIDFTDWKDDEARYVSGSYKVYKYRGRDRLRITSDAGKVILRSDWSYADGTLSFGGAEMNGTRMLPEELVDCLGVNILDYYFEEGFTEYEYPTVSVDKEGTQYSVHVGSWSMDESESTITIKDTTDSFEATAALDGYKIIVRVPAQAPRRGQVLVQEDGEAESVVANIVCR